MTYEWKIESLHELPPLFFSKKPGTLILYIVIIYKYGELQKYVKCK